jgi:hypothetical protein
MQPLRLMCRSDAGDARYGPKAARNASFAA